ncbi:MAG: DUF4157 domain-containing protein [Ferruginibacter sp.]|nr:DUF4157 domain-containing protein [Ferruginibacter sp.]
MADTLYIIKENSWIAKFAGFLMRFDKIAIVFGKTIYLHNCKKDDFLANKRWFAHEMCHIRQYKKYGYLNFIIQYLWESIKKGYTHNKFEVEARAAENEIL